MLETNSRVAEAQARLRECLTNRETQVAGLLIAGKSAREIAIALELSKRTIEHYINNIKLKLDCHKQSELIVKLIRGIDISNSARVRCNLQSKEKEGR